MASSHHRSFWPAVTAVALLLSVVIALPDAWKPWAPKLLAPELRLGLDLAGGTQLDFRISEDEIKERIATISSEIAALKGSGDSASLSAKQAELASVEKQYGNIVEAIRTVLERRINSLGVSEATITPSYFGDEKHLLVECPGIIDVDQCIRTVGKTIRLEFKEEFSGDPAAYERDMRAKATAARADITKGNTTLQTLGQDLSNELGMSYGEHEPVYVSTLPKELQPIAKRSPGDPLFVAESSITGTIQDSNGQPQLTNVRGITFAEVVAGAQPSQRAVTDPAEAMNVLQKSVERGTRQSVTSRPIGEAPAELQSDLGTMAIGSLRTLALPGGMAGIVYLGGRIDGGARMEASHILVQYAGAERAPSSVTRTRDEAQAKAAELLGRIRQGTNFDTLARTESDAESRGQGGALGVIRRGQMTPAFEAAAFSLAQGGISDVVETPFGFHIIRADQAVTQEPPAVTYEFLRFSGTQEAAAELAQRIEAGTVTVDDQLMILRTLFFSLTPTGWQDTALNGERFRSASVSFDNLGTPLVQIQFDPEGGRMFQEMTKRNVGKRIAIFVGGDLISAPTVQGEISGGNAVITGSRTVAEAQSLAQDLNTGAIPAPIFLSGQSTIEPTLGQSALRDSIKAALIGFVILCVLLIVVYRMLGVVACVALLSYVALLIASMKLPILLVTNQYVVLTLAGIAGIILSVGMAVDANVLVFERVKEELRRGKSLRAAIDIGFSKAWPSIRDGNASTVITCAILFLIGTSIIRGFAVTLVIGLVISLFTSVVMSRWICRWLVSTAISHRPEFFSGQKGK